MITSYMSHSAERDRPSLSASSTISVASGCCSRSTQLKATRCSARKVLVRRQSGHQLAPITVMVLASISIALLSWRSYTVLAGARALRATLAARSATIRRVQNSLAGRLDVEEGPGRGVEALFEEPVARTDDHRV